MKMEYQRITNTDKRTVLGESYTTIKDTVRRVNNGTQ